MSDVTPHLGLPLIAAAQAQKHVTHNEALGLLDALVQLACLDKDLSAPPGSPSEGDRYLVTAANPTGAWAGLSGQVVRLQDGVWAGAVPRPGWFAYVIDEADLYIFDGAAWTSFRRAITAIEITGRLGVNTTADALNRLAVKADAALLSWDDATPGSGHMRIAVNKQAAARDAGLIFETGYSARALIGTLGSDDFTLKVSGDGTGFSTALTASAATGGVDFCSPDTVLASAATVDLGSTGTRRVVVSGSAAITGFGSVPNRERLLRFTGAATLTHDAGRLVLPTRVNIVAAADDTCIATSDAAGNWRVRHYQRADGTPLAGGGGGGGVASVAGRTGAVTLTSADLADATAVGWGLVAATSAAGARSALAAAASGANGDITALASPALGAATAATAAAGTSTTQVATTAFVAASFLTTASAAAAYAPLASPALTGVPTAPTAAVSTGTTQVATTAFVLGQAATAPPPADGTAAIGTSALFARQDHVHPTDGSRAPLASPTFTGTPAAPTAAADTGTTQLATTAFVLGQAGTGAPAMNGAAASGTSTRFARADHVHPTDASLAPFASPTLTGTPTAPTPAARDNSTRLATTAYADRGDAALTARTQVNDAAYAILPADRTVAVIALTAARTLTLPAASAYPQGATLTVVDESGACSAASTITVARNSPSDSVNGGASAILATAFGYVALQSNGAGKWTVVDAAAPVASVAGRTGAVILAVADVPGAAPLASPALTGTPTAPTAAAGTSTGQLATTAFVAGAVAAGGGSGGSGAPGFRRRTRNGSFSINQRGVSGTVTLAAGAYGHDGWKAGAGGCTYTFGTAANGDSTLTITAGTLLQVMEGALYTPEGGAYVLSWSGSAAGRAYQGTTSGSYAASPFAATGLAGGTSTIVEFGTGTLGLVQFEPGTAATAFERRDDELRRCQRYYETGQNYVYGSAYAGGASLSVSVRLAPKMAAPTVTQSPVQNGNFSYQGVAVTSPQDMLFYGVATSGGQTIYYQFNWTASAEP